MQQSQKSRLIFFRSWEVNFDMIDIEPSLERSTVHSSGVAMIWRLLSGKTYVPKRVFHVVLDW